MGLMCVFCSQILQFDPEKTDLSMEEKQYKDEIIEGLEEFRQADED